MKNKKYVIINAEAIEARIEELKKDYKQKAEINENQWCSIIAGEIIALKRILSQSTPLITEIEKAFTKGERYGWDSQKSIGNIDEMKEKIKLQSLENYISNLKLDI